MGCHAEPARTMAGPSSGGTGSKRKHLPAAAVNDLSAVKGWKPRTGGLPPSFRKSSLQRYNLFMYRAALLTLLVASLLTAPVWAQRGGGGHAVGVHVSGGHTAGVPGHSGFGGRRADGRFGSRRFARDRGAWNNYGYGGIGDYPYFLPDDWYDGDGQDGTAPPDSAPPPVVVQRVREERARPLPPAQVIEIPSTGSAVTKSLPPTVFILTSGERLESDRFVLTANSLSINVHRSLRTVPLSMLDIDATLAANRDRGIDLRIPSDRNEISLRF
jgi:hypothetical protein